MLKTPFMARVENEGEEKNDKDEALSLAPTKADEEEAWQNKGWDEFEA